MGDVRRRRAATRDERRLLDDLTVLVAAAPAAAASRCRVAPSRTTTAVRRLIRPQADPAWSDADLVRPGVRILGPRRSPRRRRGRPTDPVDCVLGRLEADAATPAIATALRRAVRRRRCPTQQVEELRRRPLHPRRHPHAWCASATARRSKARRRATATAWSSSSSSRRAGRARILTAGLDIRRPPDGAVDTWRIVGAEGLTSVEGLLPAAAQHRDGRSRARTSTISVRGPRS